MKINQNNEPEIINPLDEPTEPEIKWGKGWHKDANWLTEKQRFSIGELKRLIKYKYGSVRIFNSVSNFDPWIFHNICYGRYKGKILDQKLHDIVTVIKNTPAPPKPVREDVISWENRMWMKVRVYTKFGNIAKFCAQYPEYKESWMNHLFKGRKKFYSPKIDKLVQILNATYDE